MFPDVLVNIAIALLIMFAAGGVAWVFIYPYLSGDAQASKRLDRIAGATSRRVSQKDVDLRRQSVEKSLKEFERRQSSVETNPPLEVRMEQAGLSISKNTFLLMMVAIGFGVTMVGYSVTNSLLVAPLGGLATFLLFPRMYLNRLRRKRFDRFINEFPNALDVITRGVKAGLPLIDCIRICSQDSAEPVRSEFKLVMEAQALNVPIATAVDILYERVPVAEVNFFSIVIAVQQKSGGNLSEVLTNLSKVLRERKKMRMKAKSLASEAVIGARIIGSLPILIALAVYILNPEYISLLWERTAGQIMLGISAVMMAIGTFVMKRMIDIDI